MRDGTARVLGRLLEWEWFQSLWWDHCHRAYVREDRKLFRKECAAIIARDKAERRRPSMALGCELFRQITERPKCAAAACEFCHPPQASAEASA